MLMVVAPSGAGKSSLVNALLESDHSLQLSLSCTTRDPRAGELDGRDYAFISKEQFLAKRDSGDFLEWAEVHGNLYGTSRSWIEGQMQKGSDVILEIDWQGAQQIRRAMQHTRSIYIVPPSRDALQERLEKRSQDSADVIQGRMEEAVNEMSHYNEFDYLVVNDDFYKALDELCSIFVAERLQISKQSQRHQSLLVQLLS